jgi:flagellar M-ring protein FliF
VPANYVDQERLAAASAGLPASSTVGLSLLDKEGLTTSQLTQQADYLQALQGELQQTINSISGVTGSQVNLAMPANQTFALGTTNPTAASVLVDLSSGHSLSYQQVQAITNLVASSIPGLTASEVTVADNSGDLLAGPGVSDTGQVASSAQQAFDSAEQAKIEAYLDGAIGVGNADVQVNATLDFNKVNTQTRAVLLGKNGKPQTVCTSTQQQATKYTGAGTPAGVTGINTNTAANSTGTYSQSERQQTCEASTQSQTMTNSPGTIQQQSVAVLVNSKAIPKGMSLKALQQGVAAAAGIVVARGDILRFSAAPFAPPVVAATPKVSMLTMYAKPGIAVLLFLIVLFLLWRAQRRAKRKLAEPDPLLAAIAELSAPRRNALDEPTGELPAVRIDEKPVASLQELIDTKPDEATTVLRQYLKSLDGNS